MIFDFLKIETTRKALIYYLRGMKRKAHGAQEPRHI